jgi:hypothetical protein
MIVGSRSTFPERGPVQTGGGVLRQHRRDVRMTTGNPDIGMAQRLSDRREATPSSRAMLAAECRIALNAVIRRAHGRKDV